MKSNKAKQFTGNGSTKIVCDLASAKIRSLRHVIPYDMVDKCQHFREGYLAYYTTSLSVGS